MLRKVLIAGAAVILMAMPFVVYLIWTLTATATVTPGMGCEAIRWGLLRSQLRTICDGPRRPDGSWDRTRTVWVPAHHVPYSCYCGSYSCSCSGGYDVDDTIVAYEKYIVFDYNALPDEPGWLPPGTEILKP